MRIATWNVNSLGARMERVLGWLEHASPDVVLLQETKLANEAAPHQAFEAAGYQLAHHGQGRWNGVAILSKVGLEGVEVGFGDPARAASDDEETADPFAEARIIAASCGGLRVASVYVPNGRTLDSPFYRGKLAWLARLEAWCRAQPQPLVVGGDFNVAPTDDDVWDPAAVNGGTHVSEAERAKIRALLDTGLVDAYRRLRPEPQRYSWWDYRAGMFHKNAGMRIDLLLASAALEPRMKWAEIDREARKGKPTPSDHAPVVLDLDEPGKPFDAGWEAAAERIKKRTR